MKKLPVEMETVDASTGKTVKKETVQFDILPSPPGTCARCGVKHQAAEPHNAQAMYYLYRFYGEHGRWPTWADAIAHCSITMQGAWIAELTRRKAWKPLPANTAPIAEAYEVQP